ncbi:hypothetical protein K474DRAFT_1660581 [Panus rudis PR-1116 ss-1]|nr:hypothetical protein K474DRAFT_1660581 [Panus rudis PR-1116 ss-1]
MLAALSKVQRTTTAKPKAVTCTFIAFYSTVSGLARRNWGTTGPAPRSLLQTYEEVEAEEESSSSNSGPSIVHKKPEKKPTPRQFVAHTAAIKASFPKGWDPPKKLSRDAMEGLRTMHAMNPDIFTTPVLADKFKISPEAVRRILKSKWEPTREQRARLLQRERKQREEWIAERRREEKQKQKEMEEEWVKRRGFAGKNEHDKLELT